MFKLKDYQDNALTALDSFFRQLRMNGLAGAWQSCVPLQEKQGQSWQAAYNGDALGDTPAVCVRIPTGGGKTFLAPHAVACTGKTVMDSDV